MFFLPNEWGKGKPALAQSLLCRCWDRSGQVKWPGG
jgi:hypothetical protein